MNKFDELIKIVKKLRAPDGCEWDREQTHESLIPYLLEETHEVIESIENKDFKSLKQEQSIDAQEVQNIEINKVNNPDDIFNG